MRCGGHYFATTAGFGGVIFRLIHTKAGQANAAIVHAASIAETGRSKNGIMRIPNLPLVDTTGCLGGDRPLPGQTTGLKKFRKKACACNGVIVNYITR